MKPTDRGVEIMRVVVVSPGDVPRERDLVGLVVDGLNRQIAPAHGCHLSLWRWEEDARSGLHLKGPQGLIDERMQIEESDVTVGMLWKRVGTPTSDAASGTEHELRKAWGSWSANGRPGVMLYFCQRNAFPKDSEEAEQLRRVFSGAITRFSATHERLRAGDTLDHITRCYGP